MLQISFSWDDGAIEDLKLMKLSMKYKIPGIFFIPANNTERSVMNVENIKLLAKNNFEIGAHTFSHTYLNSLCINAAEKEMETGKDFLEQLKRDSEIHVKAGEFGADMKIKLENDGPVTVFIDTKNRE